MSHTKEQGGKKRRLKLVECLSIHGNRKGDTTKKRVNKKKYKSKLVHKVHPIIKSLKCG